MERVRLRVAELPSRPRAHVYHLQLSGDLDLAAAPVLAEHFDRCIAAGATSIILDATDVQFMDSTGMRTIISAGNRLTASGGRLLVDGVSGAVERVLEISGLIDRYRRRPA